MTIVPRVASSVPLRPQENVIAFELREPRTTGDRAEVLRRRVIDASDADDEGQLMNAAQELLNIYPMSALAYERLGRMHERKGRAADALDCTTRRSKSLASRDRLFLEHNPAARVEAARCTAAAIARLPPAR